MVSNQLQTLTPAVRTEALCTGPSELFNVSVSGEAAAATRPETSREIRRRWKH